MSIVNLPDGFVALNEEAEAIVNDGTIKYSKLFQI